MRTMTQRRTLALGAAIAFLPASICAADGNSEIDQIYDGNTGIASERNTQVDLATTADDFVTTSKSIIQQIRATFLVTQDPTMRDWEFVLYENGNDLPGAILMTSTGGVAENIGEDFGLDLLLISFENLGIQLDPDTRYWLSVRGIGNGAGRAFWGTANFNNVSGVQAHFLSESLGFPDWTPLDQIINAPADVAFTMTLIPGPGALALLPLSAMLMSRRRRPSKHGDVK